MADNYTMRIRAGDTYILAATYNDPDGDPIDMSGWTHEWFISVGKVVNTYTHSPQAIRSGSTILMILSAEETALFLTGRGRFFLRVTSDQGVVTTLLEGGVEVEFNQ